MCHQHSEVSARRELKLAGGVIAQCLICGKVGIEFGTSYLTFLEEEFLKFAGWFDRLDEQSVPVERNKLLIQVQGSSGVMLSLAPGEIRSLRSLLREGLRWLPAGSPGASQGLLANQDTDGLVN